METPMLDKMAAVKEDSQAIGEFLAWLNEKGYVVCRARKDAGPGYEIPYYPAGESIDQLLADYFGIDLDAAERERRAVLDHLRSGEDAGPEDVQRLVDHHLECPGCGNRDAATLVPREMQDEMTRERYPQIRCERCGSVYGPEEEGEWG